jgi:hypothetical protein
MQAGSDLEQMVWQEKCSHFSEDEMCIDWKDQYELQTSQIMS